MGRKAIKKSQSALGARARRRWQSRECRTLSLHLARVGADADKHRIRTARGGSRASPRASRRCRNCRSRRGQKAPIFVRRRSRPVGLELVSHHCRFRAPVLPIGTSSTAGATLFKDRSQSRGPRYCPPSGREDSADPAAANGEPATHEAARSPGRTNAPSLLGPARC